MVILKSILSKTLVVACLFGLVAANAAAGEILRAPVNPDYVKYLKDRAQGLVQSFTSEGYALGYIPPFHKIPKAKVGDSDTVQCTPPGSYDLRDFAGVTPVRNQGACGSCWSFATFASMESFLKFKKGSTRNFSEKDLITNHGFDYGECDGGNEKMSTAYLARWSGPLNETDVPYSPAIAKAMFASVQKHAQQVRFIPDRASFTDNQAVKVAVMLNGAVYCSFYYNLTYFNSAKGSYYYSGSAYANHAVAIVGWDDSYGKLNFKNPPPYNGAFLIKNSWGTGFGNSGYFWMSYYDTSLGGFAQFLNAEPTSNFTTKYEYDPLGWVSSLGYGDNTAYGANIFTAGTGANENNIKAVSFYSPVPGSTVEISIYKNLPATKNTDPKAGTKVGTTFTKTITSAGYNTVRFPTPYLVTAGRKFSVVIRFTTPGYTYPLPMESPVSSASSATARIYQSFFSHSGTSWTDVHRDYSENANICIKAFAGL